MGNTYIKYLNVLRSLINFFINLFRWRLRDNPGMGHCQFMRKLCKIEEIWLPIWKGPLYNLSKYAVSFGLGPQIRVHRPLHFRWWSPVFANGPLFLSILLREGPFGPFWWPLPSQIQSIPCQKERGGCTNACICVGTHSQPLLLNRLMDVYETW